jgi:RNA polymerase sigma-70 factor, ECF subfamily
LHTHCEIALDPAPAPSQPEKPPLLDEVLTEQTSDTDEWPENVVFEQFRAATDPTEKEALFNDLAKLLKKHALSVFNPEFQEDRSDLANLVVEAVLRYYPTFQGRNGCKFSSWVHQIILNIRKKALRKMLRDRPFSQQFIEGIVPTNDDGELFIPIRTFEEERAHDAIQIQRIRESLEGEDAILFDMFREGRSAAEMAEVLGVSENSVRCRWFRLRDKIKRNFPRF